MLITAKQARRLMENDRERDNPILSFICRQVREEAEKGRGHLKFLHLRSEAKAWLRLNGYQVFSVQSDGREFQLIFWDEAQI